MADTGVLDTADIDPGIIADGDFMSRYYRRHYSRGHPRGSWGQTFVPDDEYIPYTRVGAGFYTAVGIDNWRIRGKYYDDYYKMTGKRPRYYSRFTRRRVKW